MSEVRYGIALLLVCVLPGVFLYWLSIHPGVSFWRGVGVKRTLTLHYGLMALIGWAVASQRRWILAVEYGNNVWLAAGGAALLVLAGIFLRGVRAQLRASTLLGLPELDPAGHPQALLTEGVYARIRHPRYVQVSLALWSWALLANYLAVYVAALLALPLVWLLVWLEERELRARFGAAYDEYARRVPRFLPHLG
jgi:protein-S-isoprenylcysteine O-methyltransferase Ste14